MVLLCVSVWPCPHMCDHEVGGRVAGLWLWELVCFEPGQEPTARPDAPLQWGEEEVPFLSQGPRLGASPLTERPLLAGSLEISLQGHDASCHRHAGLSRNCNFSSWSRRRRLPLPVHQEPEWGFK